MTTQSEPKNRAKLGGYKDDQNITKNMKDSVSWAVAYGVMNGSDDGYLKPTLKHQEQNVRKC